MLKEANVEHGQCESDVAKVTRTLRHALVAGQTVDVLLISAKSGVQRSILVGLESVFASVENTVGDGNM